ATKRAMELPLSLLLAVVLAAGAARGAPAADAVKGLPGLEPQPAFAHYSGFLSGGHGAHLHYWFVESARNPASDPVVLWLNGGPGCSSIDGFLSENGPFHVNDDGRTLYYNNDSWNKVANILYLESPAGVGFSFSDDKNYTIDDDQVADRNYAALQDFFAKFPEFSGNDFFIFGESYGGIYVPTLSLRVTTGAAKINFKGFAVGNGLSSYAINDQSLVYFAYYHGLLGESLWADLNSYCCSGAKCNFYNSSSSDCKEAVMRTFHIVYEIGLNVYALYLDCAGGIGPHSARYRADMSHLFRAYSPVLPLLPPHHQSVAAPGGGLRGVPPCLNGTGETNWINQRSVRAALHIPDGVQAWQFCSDVVGANYVRVYSDMFDVYQKLLGHGLRGLVYNGDTDMACNFLGDKWFVESLQRKKLAAQRAWIVDDQIAGFCHEYDGITFLTVKGAGHMVPQWAPRASFKMFQSFIANKPL
uniref:Carboxypeptidase n=1 Tax=Petromyzon marinus TaxID=7757 RepID=S4RP17_PETMA